MKHARGRTVDPTPPTGVDIDTSDLPEYATTAAEWWQITERIWPAIISIANRLGAKDEDIKRLELLKGNKDRTLYSIFDKMWLQAPDEYFIHTWPQWSRFCDLCSEAGVLYESDDPDSDAAGHASTANGESS